MPNLDTPLHLNMLKVGKRKRRFSSRFTRALKVLFAKNDVYGLEWGDPDVDTPLTYIRNHFLIPYVTPTATIAEIGPGGGRWTRYMLTAKRLYAIDYYPELLNELKANVDCTSIVYVKNGGDDFPGVPKATVDFVFSFGTFVHLDVDIIDRYLKNMRPVLRSKANVVIQYSDKTKPVAKMIGAGFSENDPDMMREIVLSNGYVIYEEDLKTLSHSSIVRFGLSNTTP